MGGIFSTEEQVAPVPAASKFDCQSCSWKPVAFCADENGKYDASCHNYEAQDPRNFRNKLKTHGYECIASKEENKNSGLYTCNTNICKEETLSCNESDIPQKPSGGDPWPAEDFTTHNVEISCKTFLENHAKSGAYVNVDFMKNKCSEIFATQITSDRHEFKKYCDDHFFRYPNSKKYKDVQDCYTIEAPRFASNENAQYCEDYLQRYPQGKYKDIQDCLDSNFNNEYKQFCDDHFTKYPNSEIYLNVQDCYNKENPQN